MTIVPENIGLLIWLVWALVGLLTALIVQRITSYKQMLVFNIIIGVVGAVLGGFLSVQFIGATPTMMLLISILGAVFGAGIMLWIVAALMRHFSKR